MERGIDGKRYIVIRRLTTLVVSKHLSQSVAGVDKDSSIVVPLVQLPGSVDDYFSRAWIPIQSRPACACIKVDVACLVALINIPLISYDLYCGRILVKAPPPRFAFSPKGKYRACVMPLIKMAATSCDVYGGDVDSPPFPA